MLQVVVPWVRWHCALCTLPQAEQGHQLQWGEQEPCRGQGAGRAMQGNGSAIGKKSNGSQSEHPGDAGSLEPLPPAVWDPAV